MTFWYAIQAKNYDEVIEDGGLWTSPRANGVKLEAGRENIFRLGPGDIVFHHARSCLRAVSVVTDSWVDWPRGPAYPTPEGEGDEGWLVRTRPLEIGFELRFEDVAQLIELGAPGPFTQQGHPQRKKFISQLSDDDGTRLLDHLGLEYLHEGLYGRPATEWLGGETDAPSISTIRKEQSSLRRYLLGGRTIAQCSLCQAELPDRFLIAGHIKPRALCSEEERRDYRAAMLVCNLGCDALFEWGYVVVGDDGRIEPGISAETEAVRGAVDALAGRRCSAYDEETAPRFEFHRQLRAG